MVTPSYPSQFCTTRRTILVLGSLGMSSLALAALNWAAVAEAFGACGTGVAIAVELPQTGQAGPAAERIEKAAAKAAARKGQVAVEYLPRPSQEEERILEALATPVDVEFIELPLEDCLNSISVYPQLPKFSLLLDRPTLTDEGVALDQFVTLRLKGLRLESVLNLILRPVQLEFLVEDDVLMITTSAKAGEKLITRTYPVGDLFPGRADACEGREPKNARFGTPELAVQQAAFQGFGAGPRNENEGENSADKDKGAKAGITRAHEKFTDLVAAIETTIEPDSWDGMSGPGTYTYVKKSSSLVIRQTWKIHREILQLLRDLREVQGMLEADAK